MGATPGGIVVVVGSVPDVPVVALAGSVVVLEPIAPPPAPFEDVVVVNGADVLVVVDGTVVVVVVEVVVAPEDPNRLDTDAPVVGLPCTPNRRERGLPATTSTPVTTRRANAKTPITAAAMTGQPKPWPGCWLTSDFGGCAPRGSPPEGLGSVWRGVDSLVQCRGGAAGRVGRSTARAGPPEVADETGRA